MIYKAPTSIKNQGETIMIKTLRWSLMTKLQLRHEPVCRVNEWMNEWMNLCPPAVIEAYHGGAVCPPYTLGYAVQTSPSLCSLPILKWRTITIRWKICEASFHDPSCNKTATNGWRSEYEAVYGGWSNMVRTVLASSLLINWPAHH